MLRHWAAEAIAPNWREVEQEEERTEAANQFLQQEEMDSGIVVGRGDLAVDMNVRNTMAPGDPGMAVLEKLEEDLGTSLSPVFALVPKDRPVDETRTAVTALRDESIIRRSEGLHALLPDRPAIERAEQFRRETEGWVAETLADLRSIGVRPGPFRKSLDELASVLAEGPPTESWLDRDEFSDLKRRIFYQDGGQDFRVVTLFPPSAIWEPAKREAFDSAVSARLGDDVQLYSALLWGREKNFFRFAET